MTENRTAPEIALGYLMFLDRVFGMYIDCCGGVEIFADRLSSAAAAAPLGARILYGNGNPNDPNAQVHHITTPAELKERNKRDGSHQRMLSQACIVFIQSVWEDVRAELAEAFNVPLENVSSNVFGDLRHYRNAIAHKGSRLAKPPVELTFVKIGQEVVLTQGEMKSLFILLFQAINQILLKHTGKDHGFRFERGTP